MAALPEALALQSHLEVSLAMAGVRLGCVVCYIGCEWCCFDSMRASRCGGVVPVLLGADELCEGRFLLAMRGSS
jgi:hypothetical protein